MTSTTLKLQTACDEEASSGSGSGLRDTTVSITTNTSIEYTTLIEISCEHPCRDIEEEIYFHGPVPAIEAKFMLKNDGSYLVRQTTVNDRNYLVLTFQWNGKHHDTLIQRAADADVFYIYSHCALNIPELIEYHCSAKIPVNSKGALITYAVHRRDWSLYVQQVLIGKEIGKGEFGLVYNAEVLRLYWPNKKSVLKVLQRSTNMKPEERSRLLREASLMMSLKHTNIIQIYGICSDGKNMLMALERASGGSLLSYLKNKQIKSRRKANFSKDVIKGIAYLSEEFVVHRDLAARNCLVSSRGCVKVADFGLSFWGTDRLNMAGGKVPIRWLAPEVLRSSLYSTKSDTWSLGVTLYEIWSDGSRPYSGMSLREVKTFVLSGQTLKPPEGMYPLYQKVMATCFQFDVEQRLTPVQICDFVKHKGSNFFTLGNKQRKPPQQNFSLQNVNNAQTESQQVTTSQFPSETEIHQEVQPPKSNRSMFKRVRNLFQTN